MTSYHGLMRRMRWALIAVVLAGGAGVPATAAAKGVLAPPGHAGANQYFETIPTSAGNAAPPGSVKGSGSGDPGSHTLAGFGRGAPTDASLAKQGKTGQAAAALAAATAPTPASRAAKRSILGARGSAAAGSGGGSPLHGIGDALTGSDSGGLGVLLPLLLATALVVVIALGVGRVRRRTRAAS
jgi:hypothetical protein